MTVGTGEGRTPTMADIARVLGISRQSVSLALGDAPGPSPETRRRVREAAAALGYHPHLGAQALRRARSTTLGVVFSPAHAAETEILDGVYPAAAAHGCGVVLSPQTVRRSTAEAVGELLGHRCSALVVIGSDLRGRGLDDLVARAGVPVAQVGYGRRNAAYDVVRSAGETGLSDVVEHLHGLGHREITYVHTASKPATLVRRAGYLAAMARLGLVPDVVGGRGPEVEEVGAAAARHLLDRPGLPTAVVAANDQAAIGVLQTFARRGVRIPEDVSLTGFDDAAPARFSSADLTTVAQDPGGLGAAAVEVVLARRDDPARRPVEVVRPTRLVVRGSTAAPGRTTGPTTGPTTRRE